MHGIDDTEAKDVLDGSGIQCGWWRRVGAITPREVAERLTSADLELHVNAYSRPHPTRPGLVSEETPFISLAAGAVERNTFLKTNLVYPAHLTALQFASDFGRLRGDCYLFYCWVVVGLTPAVPVEHLAEEVRELTTYRRYSHYQLEGEVTAKVIVPASQIHRYEKYTISDDGSGGIDLRLVESVVNPAYVDPSAVVSIRSAF
ncbi:hypothetical protein ACIQMJ_40750 [Actinosynnema sp. NPDC091369]